MNTNICPMQGRIMPMYYYCTINTMPILCYVEKNYRVESKKGFTTEEAIEIAKVLGIDFESYDVEQFRMGLDVELEHGRRDPHTNVTNDDPILTGKIALAHLNELPDYYTRLTKMEEEAEEYFKKRNS